MKCAPASIATARATAALLREIGVREWVVSPGSRSAPLVIAAYEDDSLRRHVILDERSAAFFALGRADETGLPVALVCTSGTAPAHYLPALIEAHERDVPLIALTADRPPSLRDCGAGQTIDQMKLFGNFARAFGEIQPPDGLSAPEIAQSVFQQSWPVLTAALRPRPGPVHLNCSFDEPLVPAGDEELPPFAPTPTAAALPPTPVPEPAAVDDFLAQLGTHRSGWIVAGAAFPFQNGPWVRNIHRLATHLGWPVFSDVLNPLRHHPDAPPLITTYDTLLDAAISPPVPPELYPEAVLQIGFQPTSKNLRAFLARHPAPRYRIDPSPREKDPARHPSRLLQADLSTDGCLPLPLPSRRLTAQGMAWLTMEAACRARPSPDSHPADTLAEAAIYAIARADLPAGCHLVLGNSLPVRHAERLWHPCQPAEKDRRIFCNRGANGIDGMLSFLAGISAGNIPTAGIIGDLTFLHDLGGLRLFCQASTPTLLIVAENGGGQIFSQLPARRLACFEEAFLTPQPVNLAAVTAAHGIPCQVVSTAGELHQAIRAFPRSGLQVIFARVKPG